MSGQIWHDEYDRYLKTGHLDPPDQCLCDDCMASAKDLRVPSEEENNNLYANLVAGFTRGLIEPLPLFKENTMHSPLTVLIRESGMTPESFHRAVKPLSRMDLITLLKK